VASVDNQSVTAEIVFDVPTSGIYTIWARESGGNNVGSYNLLVQRSRNPGNARIIAQNDVVPGNMPSFGELHAFTFDGQPGEEVNLWLAGEVASNFTPLLYLFDPNGTLLGSDVDPQTAEIHTTLVDSGSHTIWVTDSGGNNTGRYVLSFADNVVDVAEDQDTIPTKFGLAQNYPNPFNPATKIFYFIPGDDLVSLVIYSVDSRVVKTLVNEQQPMGRYEVIWNGEDENGRRVASGTYLYRLNAGNFSELRRMTLVK